MDCKGTVTAINKEMWTFEVDKKTLVHMPHLAVIKNAQLPQLGDKVAITRAYCFQDTLTKHLFIYSKNNLSCYVKTNKKNDTPLLELIRKYKIGFTDLLEININTKPLESFANALCNESVDILIIAIAKIIAKTNLNCIMDKTNFCLNKIISQFSLKTISSCKYVDINSNKSDTPYWSFGSHTKTKSSEYLVGFLFVNHSYGITMLKDHSHNMVCIILENTVAEMLAAVNHFVLIKKYFVLTEIYKDENVHNVEYLVFSFKDLKVIDCSPKSIKDCMFLSNPDTTNFSNYFKFRLLNKGTVSVDNKISQPECWIEISLVDDVCQEILLCLDINYLNVVPFLKCGVVYCVHHNNDLMKTVNYKLQKIKPNVPLYRFCEETAIFTSSSSSDDLTNSLLTIEQALEYVNKTSCGFLSFQGIIKKKYFLDPLPSKQKNANKKQYSFGTPGEKVHVIEFCEKDSDEVLSLYLHNWENLQMPLGLVPHMRVAVHFVTSYNKYCKPNTLTRIEVLNYEPSVIYQTCNLYGDDDNWGEPSFLGYGDLIPAGVLIWGRISAMCVKSLKISYQCNGCKCIRKIPGPCEVCKEIGKTLNVNVILYVYDEMGFAKVISKSSELLRLLLKMEPGQWTVWCEAFEFVGEYSFADQDYIGMSQEIKIFCKAITLNIEVLNTRYISSLQLKCRKLDVCYDKNEGMPLWYCIDAREAVR